MINIEYRQSSLGPIELRDGVYGGDASKVWCLIGTRIYHREDGPAFTSIYEEAWYYNDKLHRTDGPAIAYPNGEVIWYINSHRISDAKRFQDLSGNSDEQMAEIIMKWGAI